MAEVLVGKVSDFDEQPRLLVKIDGREVVVLREDGGFYALENTCLHMGGSIAEGRLKRIPTAGNGGAGSAEGAQEVHIVCPLHGWEYDLETGEFTGDRKRGLQCYDVTTRGDEIYVRS